MFTCYDDETFVSNDVIYAVALHEIGHSFGLDHYISDNIDTNSKWQTSSNTPPSIMIPTIHNNPSLQEITDIDTSKVREIYGIDGFYAFSSIPIPEPTLELILELILEPDPEPIPEIIEPIIPDKPFSALKVSDKIIEVQNRQQQWVKISGSVSDDNLLRGHPVIITIHKPDQTIQILKTGATNNRYFETLLIFDKNSLRGNYQVSASYIEHVDKGMDVSFEIVDKIITPSIISDEQDTEPLIVSNPNLSNQIETDSDEIIPQWIKNNAKWWSEGNIDDETFVDGIEFLVKIGIVKIG